MVAFCDGILLQHSTNTFSKGVLSYYGILPQCSATASFSNSILPQCSAMVFSKAIQL